MALGIDDKPEKQKANILLHVMGEDALRVYNGFHWAEGEDKEKTKDILAKFKAYCTPRTNVTFERGLFNDKKQGNLTFEQFFSELSNLAKTCEYGEMTDELIKDRICSGVRNPALKTQLMNKKNLDLAKAVDMCRNHEATHQQVSIMENLSGASQSVSPSVQQVSAGARPKSWSQRGRGHRGRGYGHASGYKPPNRPDYYQRKPQVTQGSNQGTLNNNNNCQWCGREKHNRHVCPARNANCNHCHLKGHFQSVCRKKSVQSVHQEERYEDNIQNAEETFLGSVTVANIQSNNNNVDVQLCVDEIKCSFRADTGADATVVSDETYRREFPHKILRTSSTRLRGPDMKPLNILGYFSSTIKYRGSSIVEDIYVLPRSASLLSCDASINLGIVKIVGYLKNDIPKQFPQLFQGLGKLDTVYDIQLDHTISPYAVSAPRRVPLPLMTKVKAELDRLKQLDVIVPVEDPTPWCAPMVVVPKSSGQVRICVDLTKLNNAVLRERHLLPSVDHILGQMAGAKVFSKIDANSGFHQIPLSTCSQLLTTFITPYGRFAYKRLPFGISSGPELYQRVISRILEGLEGVVCLMDDIVVFADNQQLHDARLRAVLERIQKAGITLNRDKCVFSRDKIHFLGQIVGAAGVQADPDKVASIINMQAPRNVSELRRFLGMVNQLMKFVPNLTDKTEPLRKLLGQETEWMWTPAQSNSFQEIKKTLASRPVMALYNSVLDLKVTADASSYGLGAVLFQNEDKEWRPIAYASRSMTPTEKRYAQIEKEALALTWSCERFQDYLIGKHFYLETDHKPLIPLLGQKDIHELPVRIQRMRMRLMRYSYSIAHVPGKLLYTADTLSRAPYAQPTQNDHTFASETISYVSMMTRNLPATDKRLEEIRMHQSEDETCCLISKYVKDGWPEKSLITGMLHQYWPYKHLITIQEGLIMYEARILIPSALRLDILDKIHQGHQGISKCRERAKQSVWWPGLSKQLGDLVNNCRVCCKNHKNPVEPLVQGDLPEHPWQRIATDLFEYKQNKYLLLVDLYSRYIEIAQLDKTQSSDIIRHMKSIFARHGIPVSVYSDNGPQYSAHEFAAFAKNYGFNHITSSPGHSSGNGAAERAVRTIKDLLKGCDDPYLTLLNYRATPLANGFSPAELLMSRRLRTMVPTVQCNLHAKAPDPTLLSRREQSARDDRKRNFDRHHAARSLPLLNTGDEVWLPDRREAGYVNDSVHRRSYTVSTPTGIFRRNRSQMNSLPHEEVDTEAERSTSIIVPENPNITLQPPTMQPKIDSPQKVDVNIPGHRPCTRSGRSVNIPARFTE